MAKIFTCNRRKKECKTLGEKLALKNNSLGSLEVAVKWPLLEVYMCLQNSRAEFYSLVYIFKFTSGAQSYVKQTKPFSMHACVLLVCLSYYSILKKSLPLFCREGFCLLEKETQKFSGVGLREFLVKMTKPRGRNKFFNIFSVNVCPFCLDSCSVYPARQNIFVIQDF